MSAHVLALGTFTFSTSTAAYESLQRSTAWEWPAQARVGSYPAHHYTAETITLPGVIYPAHRPAFAGDGRVFYGNAAGMTQLDALRALAAKGEPQALADGSGKSL